LLKARYAILLDGGFVTKKLNGRLSGQAFVNADAIQAETDRLRRIEQVCDYELLRIYFYDAHPSKETIDRPISRTRYELAATERFRRAQALYDGLVLKPFYSLRMGETSIGPSTWRLKPRVQRELSKSPRPLTDQDFDLAIEQKGVDLRMGLDMARLALRDMVRAIIIVSGDSDLVPAFKFVRREGVKVILETLGHNVKRSMREHADIVL
jgi:uncharacterized LabA/DUF88 family protein